VDHVKLPHFTESDKRKVMETFLTNDEVLFFTYGMLFPQSVVTHSLSQSSLVAGQSSLNKQKD